MLHQVRAVTDTEAHTLDRQTFCLITKGELAHTQQWFTVAVQTSYVLQTCRQLIEVCVCVCLHHSTLQIGTVRLQL